MLLYITNAALMSLPKGETDLQAMQQQLIHEQKEREKLEALLEQQKCFAAVCMGVCIFVYLHMHVCKYMHTCMLYVCVYLCTCVSM